MKKNYITNNSGQTKKLGKELAKEILKTRGGKKAIIIGLKGELGGGKTTFLQGFAKGLGIKEKITSPTFVILKKFQILSFKFHWFYHIDCYRIKGSKELWNLGLKEIISDPKNIIAIEWADRVKRNLSKNTIWLKFEFLDRNKRKIMIK